MNPAILASFPSVFDFSDSVIRFLRLSDYGIIKI